MNAWTFDSELTTTPFPTLLQLGAGEAVMDAAVRVGDILRHDHSIKPLLNRPSARAFLGPLVATWDQVYADASAEGRLLVTTAEQCARWEAVVSVRNGLDDGSDFAPAVLEFQSRAATTQEFTLTRPCRLNGTVELVTNGTGRAFIGASQLDWHNGRDWETLAGASQADTKARVNFDLEVGPGQYRWVAMATQTGRALPGSPVAGFTFGSPEARLDMDILASNAEGHPLRHQSRPGSVSRVRPEVIRPLVSRRSTRTS